VVTYDHRGEWGSDAGPKPRDARQIATELRDALRAAKLEPPYVLVGYSFGGPYVRVFADMFPKEVSGLVLLDPSQEEFFDWLKVHHPDVNRITPEQEAEQNEYGCSWRTLEQARAAKVPNVPVTLITGMRPPDAEAIKLMPRWLDAHQRWLSRIPHAKHIITERSGHGLVLEEPDLVVKAIHDLVSGLPRPR
jgi:pimeloyl-ACP methyl ester carboxylesterase